jgi:two-component system, sensor histidine kinase PdtaS
LRSAEDRGRAILIVEDDEATAELERRALVRSGAAVQIVGRISGALALLEREAFSVILLDYQVPDGDPWRVVEVARSRTPRIPVVLVTATGNERVAAEALQRGIAEYVMKTGAFHDALPDVVQRVVKLALAEERLRESEARAAAILDAIPDLMVRVTADGTVLDYRASATHELHAPPEQIIGGNVRELLPGPFVEECLRYIREVLETGSRRCWEFQLSLPQGPQDFEARMVPSGSSSVLAIVRNISASKAEGVIRKALQEKEVMLREIHHRVKNNLQVISSLLKLQAMQIPDATVRDVFAKSRNRVQSIALVHEKLYRSKDLSDVDFRAYVNVLVEGLFQAHEAEERGISPVIDVGALDLAVDIAIPCGLIINELVTNALKHGFPGGRTGSVQVGFRRIDPDRVELQVADDGVGLPAEIDPRRSTTLGLDLVLTFADQLGAEVDVRRSPGTAFQLRFPCGST